MRYATILWDKHPTEQYVTVTLNRPEKLNTLSPQLIRDLDDAVTRAESDPTINAMLLKGAGRSFCAGYDMSPSDDPDALELTLDGWRAFLRKQCVDKLWHLWNATIPTVCAVHGYALGGGLELVAACDLAIAAEDAKLGEPEIRHISAPPTLFLPYTIAMRHARYLIYTGDMISGKEAERIDLVNKAVPADELDEVAHRLMTKLARMPVPGIKHNKAALNNAQQLAGMFGAFLYNVETTAAAHSSKEGVQLMSKVGELGMKKFLQYREAPFKELGDLY